MKILLLGAAIALFGFAGPALGAEAQTPCQGLVDTDFEAVQDAPTTVLAASSVQLEDGTACAVSAYVTPQVGVELLLPADWNGRFVMFGCGALCGQTEMQDRMCRRLAGNGYACVATDGGHRSSRQIDGIWAYNSIQAEVDYGFRSTHVTTLAGKAITERYYGRKPEYSYYLGASNGGRTGLIEAQQFPWDFDGMVLINPTIRHMYKAMTLLWNIVSTTDENGNPIFSRDDLENVHRFVLAKCSADGRIIEDPFGCRFDPGELRCDVAEQAACLSAQQVAAIRRVYGGPTDTDGERLFFGSMPGSELGEFGLGAARNAIPTNLVESLGRYLFFSPDNGPGWTIRDFDFDRDYKRLGVASRLYDAGNPDLRRFASRGGKIIFLQGLQDSGLSGPGDMLDFYEMLSRVLGDDLTEESMRLYLIPGMDHGVSGPGANAFNLLGTLEDWVERGQAPTTVIGMHVSKPQQFDPYVGPSRASGSIEHRRSFSPYTVAGHD